MLIFLTERPLWNITEVNNVIYAATLAATRKINVKTKTLIKINQQKIKKKKIWLDVIIKRKKKISILDEIGRNSYVSTLISMKVNHKYKSKEVKGTLE